METTAAMFVESVETASRTSPDNERIVDIHSYDKDSEDPTSTHAATTSTTTSRTMANGSSPLPKVFSLEAGSSSPNAQINGTTNTNTATDQDTRTSTRTTNTGNNDDNAGSGSSDDTKIISLDELKYGFSSYHAIFTPVSITMILSALAVIYIQTSEQARDANEEAVTGFYTVISMSDSKTTSNSNIENFGIGLVNGLIMIAGLTVATFLIVILYKYRCMKLLLGYMVACSALLLGVLGGVMFETFIKKYGVIMDKLTFYVLLVNFAAVGTISIFYAKGIPTVVTQAYLVFTSVILAWQLSFFDDLMAWILLVLLALYDLCAVLTPCGPLKALVNLMQKDDAPAMPGLLYEARLPDGVERPGRGRTNNDNANNEDGNSNGHGNGNAIENGHGNTNANANAGLTNGDNGENTSIPNGIENGHGNGTSNGRKVEQRSRKRSSRPASTREQTNGQVAENGTRSVAVPVKTSSNNDPAPTPVTGVLPFSIAKIYKLPISPQDCPQFVREKYRPRTRRSSADQSTSTVEYSVSELLTEVTVLYSPNGGRILVEQPAEAVSSTPIWRRRNGSNLPRYIVQDANGDVKRVLVMNEDGRVFEERTGPRDEGRNQDHDNEPQTIKLGLGDFIFYSVLVAKAALNSFTTFAACMLVILAGLGGTLVLLSVYHAALPALPISIFLGVIFFFTTKALIEPWVETIMTVPFYV
jgi:presenilin 1